MKHLPCGVSPDHECSAIREQCHGGAEERPKNIDAIVGIEHMLIAALESLDLAFFLSEGFHNANAGDRVGEYVDHFSPGTPGAGKAMPQPDANALPHPGDNWKRQKGKQREAGVDSEQH